MILLYIQIATAFIKYFTYNIRYLSLVCYFEQGNFTGGIIDDEATRTTATPSQTCLPKGTLQ